MDLKIFRLFRKRPLDAQIDAYLEWKLTTAPISASREQAPLKRFASFVDVSDVSLIEVRHVHEFEKYIKRQLSTNYAEQVALRSVRGLLRYYHARGYLCPAAKSVGRALQSVDNQREVLEMTGVLKTL